MRVLAFFGLVSLLPVAKAQNAVGVLVATKQHSAGPELAAKPGQSPRHIHVEDGRGSNLPDGKDGLGLNYAKHGGSHRGYVDAMFHEGEQQGIHDHEAAIASQEDYHEMWKGFHADNIAKPADTTYAGKNRPKHKFHHEFFPVEGLDTTMRVVVNGTGSRQVAVDDVVTVHAKGLEKHFGKSPGHVFYSTKNKHHGGPFTYKVGSNKLPLGWDVGCRGMRLGEKREFDIPWWEGWGKNGVANWGLRPHAEVLLTIEVLAIRTEAEAWKAMDDGEL